MSNDYKIEVTRGSGPGGQHKNKVETCVKITHIPSGITETCQDTRSKNQNLKLAKQRIITKLENIQQQAKDKKENLKRREQIQTGERTFRRRTYDFKSQIVTDHISGKKAPLQQVLNGNIELLR